MGIDYSPVLGVGVDSSKITYENLTEFAKKELLELFIDNGYMEGKFGDYYDDELIWSNVPQYDLEAELKDFFECHSADYDFIYDLGLTEYEGNSILPMYEGSYSAFVEKDVHRETDEYIPSDYLKEHLDDYEISVEEFQQTHKQIILL